MLINRIELEHNLLEPIKLIKRNRRVLTDIKNYLNDEYQILPGNIQSVFNNPEKELSLLDPRVLFLLTQQVFLKSGNLNINPEEYFTVNEIKKSKQYTGKLEIEEDIEFPLVIQNVVMFDSDTFFFPISLDLLAKLSRSRKLNYNFDIQRESVRRVVQGDIIREAKLIMKNVKDIKDNLISGEQERTAIVINAAVRTSDEGDELIFDPIERSLTITKGTRLDIVDGYHRSKATELAVEEKPEIKDFTFGCWITNYTDDRAANYQGQLAMGTPIARERQEFLSSSRNSDLVIKELKASSELKDRVSDTNVVHPTAKELVSYRVLKDSIEEQFKLEKKMDVYDVSDYLKEFFDFLFGYYQEEFITNSIETRKTTIINSNNMFYGYIVLARRMMELGIKARSVKKFISDINFRRDNPFWVEIGVLNKDGSYSDTKKSRLAIKKFFEELDLENDINKRVGALNV